MNRAHVAANLVATGRYDDTTAEQAITDVLANIINLTADGRVALAGIGTFDRVERAARTGRNPRTGEAVAIPARTVLRFRPSIAVEEAVQAGQKVTGHRKPATRG